MHKNMNKWNKIILTGITGILTASSLLVGCGKTNNGDSRSNNGNQTGTDTIVIEKEQEQGGEQEQPISAGSNLTGGKYIPEGELDDTLSNGVNQLGFRLAGTLNQRSDNYFFSPYSISSALTVLDNAAQGTTKQQLEAVLGIENLAEWNNQLALFHAREKNEQTYFNSADALWIEQTLNLNEDADKLYFPVVRDGLGAEVWQVDFLNNSDAIKKQISAWVKEKTGGMIANYDPLADASTSLDILNAVYFYGEWQKKFVEDDTHDRTFHGTNGDTSVQTMRMSDTYYGYYSDGVVRGISIPYSGGEYVMNILIPEKLEGQNMMELFEAMSEQEKQKLLTNVSNAKSTEIAALFLPKFSFDSSFNGLADVLKDLGMVDAFTGNADFEILADNLFVSDIAHRAKIEVDEQGTRAAAVTEINVKTTAVMDESPIYFEVNCPFMFFIQDKETGMVLFMGGVKNLGNE